MLYFSCQPTTFYDLIYIYHPFPHNPTIPSFSRLFPADVESIGYSIFPHTAFRCSSFIELRPITAVLIHAFGKALNFFSQRFRWRSFASLFVNRARIYQYHLDIHIVLWCMVSSNLSLSSPPCRCAVNAAIPDRRIIPFDTYNMFTATARRSCSVEAMYEFGK